MSRNYPRIFPVDVAETDRQIAALPEPLSTEFKHQSFWVRQLIMRTGVSLQILIDQAPEFRSMVITPIGSQTVVALFTEAGISFDQIASIQSPIAREAVLRTAQSMVPLLNDAKIPWSTLVILASAKTCNIFRQICGRSNTVKELCTNGGLTLAHLQQLPWDILEKLLSNAHGTLAASLETLPSDLKLNRLFELDCKNHRDLFLSHLWTYIYFVADLKIPIAQLIATSPEIVAELIEHSDHWHSLITTAHFSLSDIVSLEPAVRSDFIKWGILYTRWIVEANIPVSEIVSLSTEERQELPKYTCSIVDCVGTGFMSFSEYRIKRIEGTLPDKMKELADQIRAGTLSVEAARALANRDESVTQPSFRCT